jgi:regulator of sigma D
MIKKEIQNKTNKSLELPNWISPDSNEINNQIQNNANSNDDKNHNKKNYFSLAQIILSLIEQALSIRYVLYYKSNNLNELLESTYLNDLFKKKELILEYLNINNIEPKIFYTKFNIADINSKIFYDQNIENFIKEKKNYIDEFNYYGGISNPIIDNFCDDNTNTYCFLDKYRNDLSFLGDTHLNESKYLENYIKGNINPITKEDIDEESDDYYISKNVVNLFYLKNHAKQVKEDDDSGQNDYYYNSQDVSAENLKHFNFFPKMGKYKTKKLKKNEKPKNQFGIESFFGAKKEPKKRNSNINNNANDNISNNMNNVINQKIY